VEIKGFNPSSVEESGKLFANSGDTDVKFV
jgi:hypothetical protein